MERYDLLVIGGVGEEALRAYEAAKDNPIAQRNLDLLKRGPLPR